MDGRKATLQQQPRQPACCLFLLTPSHLQRAEPLAGVEVPESSPAVHCYRDDFRIKMGSDESHFNVALILRDKVTRQCECPQTTTFEEKGELKRIRTEVPLLTSLTPYR